MKTILVVGEGRSGKDTMCEHLAFVTTLRNAGTTSKYLAEFMAAKLGLSVEEAYGRRHESNEMRQKWKDGGDELRENGPTTLARRALEHGQITGGLRGLDEIRAVRAEGLFDVIVWVENERVPKDPTVMFTSAECDLVIENNGTLDEFYAKIVRFARFAGLPMCGEPRKVFLVSKGEYSDYGIEAVFSDREQAEFYQAECEKVQRHQTVRVEEHVLDGEVGKVARPYWRAHLDAETGGWPATGTWAPNGLTKGTCLASPTDRVIEREPMSECLHHRTITAESFVSAEHARKLVAERRQEWVRLKAAAQ